MLLLGSSHLFLVFLFLDTDTSKLGRDICATVFFRFPGASSSAFPRFPSGAFNNAPFLCARHVKALHFGQLAMGAKWGMERRFDSSARKSWLTYLVVILSLPWRWFYGIFPRLFLCKTRASLAKKKKKKRKKGLYKICTRGVVCFIAIT